jgi:hypothetical protein
MKYVYSILGADRVLSWANSARTMTHKSSFAFEKRALEVKYTCIVNKSRHFGKLKKVLPSSCRIYGGYLKPHFSGLEYFATGPSCRIDSYTCQNSSLVNLSCFLNFSLTLTRFSFGISFLFRIRILISFFLKIAFSPPQP